MLCGMCTVCCTEGRRGNAGTRIAIMLASMVRSTPAFVFAPPLPTLAVLAHNVCLPTLQAAVSPVITTILLPMRAHGALHTSLAACYSPLLALLVRTARDH